MAKYNIENYTDKDGLGFPLNFRRGNPNPLDNSSVWKSLAEAKNYAQTDPTAYVGQVLSVVNYTPAVIEGEGDEAVVKTPSQSTVDVYKIVDEAGNLEKVGTAPVGDENTITVAEDGTVSLYGIEGLPVSREEGGETVIIKYQPLYVNGKLTWVEPSATTVEDLSLLISGLDKRAKALEDIVGKPAEGETAATGLVKDVADNKAAIEVLNGTGEGSVKKALEDAKGFAQGLVDAIPAQTDYTVTITETTDGLEDNVAKKYTFTQNGATIGTINLAKELVVTSGSVKEVAEEGVPYEGAKVGDKYIELVIANQDAPIYVPAKDLVDIYVPKAGATEVQIVIDSNNEISASLVDGGVSEAKLSEEVKTKLNKTWEEVGVAKGLVDALEETINDETTGILAKAKEHANGLDKAMDERVKVVEEGLETAEEKLEGIEAGAQVNKIESVSEEFEIDANKKLGVKSIDGSKVTVNGVGLPGALQKKVDAVEGKGLSTNDFTNELKSKLDNIAAGAQVNVIEKVTVDGVEVTVDENKTVNIGKASKSAAGVVKGSDAENGVAVNSDGTMTVNEINVDKLTQTEGTRLVLNGGSAAR